MQSLNKCVRQKHYLHVFIHLSFSCRLLLSVLSYLFFSPSLHSSLCSKNYHTSWLHCLGQDAMFNFYQELYNCMCFTGYCKKVGRFLDIALQQKLSMTFFMHIFLSQTVASHPWVCFHHCLPAGKVHNQDMWSRTRKAAVNVSLHQRTQQIKAVKKTFTCLDSRAQYDESLAFWSLSWTPTVWINK